MWLFLLSGRQIPSGFVVTKVSFYFWQIASLLKFKFYLKFLSEFDLKSVGISSARRTRIPDIYIAFWCREISGVLTSQSELNRLQAPQEREPLFSAEKSHLTPMNENIHRNNHE